MTSAPELEDPMLASLSEVEAKSVCSSPTVRGPWLLAPGSPTPANGRSSARQGGRWTGPKNQSSPRTASTLHMAVPHTAMQLHNYPSSFSDSGLGSYRGARTSPFLKAVA